MRSRSTQDRLLAESVGKMRPEPIPNGTVGQHTAHMLTFIVHFDISHMPNAIKAKPIASSGRVSKRRRASWPIRNIENRLPSARGAIATPAFEAEYPMY